MSKSPFFEGKSLQSDDAPVTYVRDLGNEFAMDSMGRRAVAEQYQGTEEDQYTMKVLGRTQELRVRESSSRFWMYGRTILMPLRSATSVSCLPSASLPR